jgi:predicted phage terminase large subunit-like protein
VQADTAIESGLYAALRLLDDATARAVQHESPALAPQPGPQSEFVAADEDVVIYGGQAGGGKTYGLLLAALRYKNEPSYAAVIFRRTVAQVRKPGGLWDQAMEVYPKAGGVPRIGALSFTFPGGATISFSHLEDEKNKLDWQGAQLGFIGFDEITHFTESQFWYLLSRARAASPGIRPMVRATCNPDPDSFVAELLYDRWIDRASGLPIEAEAGRRWHFGRDGERLAWSRRASDLSATAPRSFTFIPSTLDDNPILAANDPAYRANLEALPYVERMRLLHGNWSVRPTAGMVFSRAWLEVVRAVPDSLLDVRYWDKAGTEGGGCHTAGVRMRRVGGTFYVVDVVAVQHEAVMRERLIRQVAELDGRGVEVVVEQEPGSGGKESAESTIRNLAGWRVRSDRVTGSKVSRWYPLAAQAEAGNVKVLAAPWTNGFLDALHNADGEKPSRVDMVDAAAGAFAALARGRLTTGIG